MHFYLGPLPSSSLFQSAIIFCFILLNTGAAYGALSCTYHQSFRTRLWGCCRLHWTDGETEAWKIKWLLVSSFAFLLITPPRVWELAEILGQRSEKERWLPKPTQDVLPRPVSGCFHLVFFCPYFPTCGSFSNWMVQSVSQSVREGSSSASAPCQDVVGKLLGPGLVLPLITRKHLPELLNCHELQILLSEVEMTTLDLCHRAVMTANSDQSNRRNLQTEFSWRFFHPLFSPPTFSPKSRTGKYQHSCYTGTWQHEEKSGLWWLIFRSPYYCQALY